MEFRRRYLSSQNRSKAESEKDRSRDHSEQDAKGNVRDQSLRTKRDETRLRLGKRAAPRLITGQVGDPQ